MTAKQEKKQWAHTITKSYIKIKMKTDIIDKY